MPRDAKTARHAEVERRYRRKAKRPPASIATLRIRDLTKLYRARHGYVLPDSKLGRDCAMIACHHLSELPSDPRKRISGWLELWCPWMPIAEAKALTAEAIMEPRRWRADKLGWRLQLIEADRTALGLTTIGAIDLSKGERIKRRKALQKALAEQRRRAKGAVKRAEYLAAVTKPKPWIAAGMSRATWYRQRRRETTNPK